MVHSTHVFYGKPSYVFRAMDDEPWDYEAFYANFGEDFGLFRCVVEYDFAFKPDGSLGAPSKATDPGSDR